MPSVAAFPVCPTNYSSDTPDSLVASCACSLQVPVVSAVEIVCPALALIVGTDDSAALAVPVENNVFS